MGMDDAAFAMAAADSSTPGAHHSFNLGSMVLLPKKPADTDPLLGDYFTASDTRPLVIVNTDNRIIANAMRFRLEPELAGWISHEQRGFLGGRSMLTNVIDVEHGSQQAALKEEQGATILLDFKAAFPSLSHGFLHGIVPVET